MANRTAKDAATVKGTNPQYLVEKISRSRIYESKYWKEKCFAVTAELLVDRAMELDHIGGTFGGNVKPTPFLCLILKMLQIQPEKDIIVEFIKNEDYKYVRALGAIYMRLVGTSIDCYNYLEPLYNDFRKLKRKQRSGQFEVIHMDEFVEELLQEDRVCDTILPRIQKRYVLEQSNKLEPRVSALDEDIDIESDDQSESEDEPVKSSRHRSRSRDRDKHSRRSRSPRRRRSSRSPNRRKSRSPRRRSRSPRRRSRSRSPRRRSRSPRRRSRSPRRRSRSHSPRRRSRSHSPRRRSRSRSPRRRSRSPRRRRHKHSASPDYRRSRSVSSSPDRSHRHRDNGHRGRRRSRSR